ncbi:hypothetical protein PR202_ga13086 [Eleusine coracana subsp. coracana]|uniref:Uncharacterized protein n=1 Tax=Eleusine coracana subsp. coracana TaxID=191504 RepID=A0AAV5CDU7_ELECO|nr:hypothetical protein PR202_ga13086 [Eleusine coracana subsp. coracana]
MYRGNLHLSGGAEGTAPRRWELPRPAISGKRFRRLLRSRTLAFARLAGEEAPPRTGSPASPIPSSSAEAGEEQQGQLQNEGEQQVQQQQQPEEGEVEQQQQQVEEAEEAGGGGGGGCGRERRGRSSR